MLKHTLINIILYENAYNLHTRTSKKVFNIRDEIFNWYSFLSYKSIICRNIVKT